MVRKIFILFTAILFATAAMAGAPKTGPAGDETLSYVIHHSLWDRALGTLDIEGEIVEGGNYCVRANMETDPVFRGIYSLNAIYESTFRYGDGYAMRFAWHTLIEKNYWRTADYRWSGTGDVGVRCYKKDRPDVETVVPAFDGSRDILGAIWYLRTLDYTDRTRPVSLHVIHDSRAISVYLRSSRATELMVDGEEVPVIEVALARDRNPFMTIWFTDDAVRTPLLFRVDVGAGSVEGALDGYDISEVVKDPRAVEPRMRPLPDPTVMARGPKVKNVLPVKDPWESMEQDDDKPRRADRKLASTKKTTAQPQQQKKQSVARPVATVKVTQPSNDRLLQALGGTTLPSIP